MIKFNINKYYEEYKKVIKYLPNNFIEEQYNNFDEFYDVECGINKDISFGLHLQNILNKELCNQIRNGNVDLEIELIETHLMPLEYMLRKLNIKENVDKEGVLISSFESYEGKELLSLHILKTLKNTIKETQKISSIQKEEKQTKTFEDTVLEYLNNNKIKSSVISDLDKLFIKLNVCEFIEDETLKKYIYLKFGYYNNLYFCNYDISKILDITLLNINEMYKECLNILKSVIEEKVNMLLEYYTNSPKQIKIKKY